MRACTHTVTHAHTHTHTHTHTRTRTHRYIYLWIKYALFEELDAEDTDRAREVYRAALKLVPHHIFTFSKVTSAALGWQI